jgi:thiamine transport system ATP-binding protein
VLRIHNVAVRRGPTLIFRDASLHVQPGERVAIHGPSGCGKTTLLHAIAGLVQIEMGTIEIAGKDVTNTPAHQRGVGLVFQDDLLFSHFDVADNVSYALRVRGVPTRDRRFRAEAWLERVGLPGFASRAVQSLSGGEAKRVALARTLAATPRVVLLDEPLTGLDNELRDHMLHDLRSLFAELATTVLLVTHDRLEGAALCHRSLEFASLSTRLGS